MFALYVCLSWVIGVSLARHLQEPKVPLWVFWALAVLLSVVWPLYTVICVCDR